MICDGNSLTAGQGGTPYPTTLGTLLGPTATVTNKGVGAATTAARAADAEDDIDAYYNQYVDNIAVLWEIRNSLYYGETLETVKTQYQNWCQGRRDAGFAVVAVTLLPGTANLNWDETNRQAINTWLRANYTSFADGLADVAADTRIGDAGDNLDGTYYTDGTHMTSAGYAIVAGIVKSTIDGL